MAEATASSNRGGVGKRSKRRDLAEIAIAYGLILAVIWTPRPWQSILWWLAAAGVLGIMAASFDGLAAMGLRRRNFWRSLWIAGVALALAGIAIAVAAHERTLKLPGGPLAFLAAYCAYGLWAGVQQLLLQGFFLLRFLRILSAPRGAALAAALLFSLAHVPSVFLAPLTFAWGLVACILFLRYRNLYPLALAHAILGVAVAMTVPGTVDHNMRVGLGYLKYHHRRHLLAQPPLPPVAPGEP